MHTYQAVCVVSGVSLLVFIITKHYYDKKDTDSISLNEVPQFPPDLNLVNYKPIVLTEATDPSALLRNIALQKQITCPNWKLFGKTTDGGWPVCMARTFTPVEPCTVYSFGINNDWSFDDAYRAHYGCLLRTFDPSMKDAVEHEHSPGVYFYPVGLSDKKEVDNRGWNMDNFKGILTHFGDQDKIIPYLKFDIETSEWNVLQNMLSDGSLKNVMQFAFEIHVDTWANAKDYFQLIKGLETLGFRRWYRNRRYGRFLFQSDQAYINVKYIPHHEQWFGS